MNNGEGVKFNFSLQEVTAFMKQTPEPDPNDKSRESLRKKSTEAWDPITSIHTLSPPQETHKTNLNPPKCKTSDTHKNGNDGNYKGIMIYEQRQTKPHDKQTKSDTN